MVSQRKDKTSYSVIGVMAGSSMDGLDLAHAIFSENQNRWTYQLGKCDVIGYPENLFDRLEKSPSQKNTDQQKLDKDFGEWIAVQVNSFKKNLPQINVLGVHGHTVIHKPHEQISWQLGKGEVIAKKTGLTTVTEFRTEDVKHNGQGAPLVPFGDFALFNSYDACLNLGGIANISIRESKQAWDICPCNQVLNHFAEKLGMPYDKDGRMAQSGNFDKTFHDKVLSLEYFNLKPPKSLPNNFISLDILDMTDPKDGLYTYCQVVADQIQKSVAISSGSKLLITGGGAFNTYLVELLNEKLKGWDVHVPEDYLVSYKESLVFGFLALKRLRNEINTLSSVTGASKDLSSGVIHLP